MDAVLQGQSKFAEHLYLSPHQVGIAFRAFVRALFVESNCQRLPPPVVLHFLPLAFLWNLPERVLPADLQSFFGYCHHSLA